MENTLKLFFLTSLKKKISPKYVPNKLEINEIRYSLLKLEIMSEDKKLKNVAPRLVGKYIKKEKSRASSKESLLLIPKKVVIPLLLIPGINPIICPNPIRKLFFAFKFS